MELQPVISNSIQSLKAIRSSESLNCLRRNSDRKKKRYSSRTGLGRVVLQTLLLSRSLREILVLLKLLMPLKHLALTKSQKHLAVQPVERTSHGRIAILLTLEQAT